VLRHAGSLNRADIGSFVMNDSVPASRIFRAGAIAAAALSGYAAAAQAAPPEHVVTTVLGLSVDQYRWNDSKGLPRTVSLKQEGNGNPGHGGYAVQMTYTVPTPTGTRVVTADAPDTGDGGFGYFVSHERYRDFTDGANDTIAGHVFGVDDSPLGRNFPVVGTAEKPVKNPNALSHRFTLTYRRYGTIDPIPKDANGNDVRRTPVNKSKLALYPLPITITWVFEEGKDYPRIVTQVDLSQVGQPDLVNFDVRGPYGVLVFDDDTDGVIDRVMWGDRFHFATTQDPPTRNSGWTWEEANAGGRYSALIAGDYEMGLFEPKRFAKTALADGYADERGSNSTDYNGGNGCSQGQTQLLPCDWEWPYQSIQYSLPDTLDDPAYFKKMAWGSTAFYGSGPSLPFVFDTATTSVPFNGFPDNQKIQYSICVVLGLKTSKGLTRSAASHPARCASPG
jgi:hypothetical protein